MTKFILHGGKSRVDCENNRKFYREMFNIDKENVNLLIISFARPKDKWRLPQEEVDKIIRLNPDKQIYFQSATQEGLIRQLEFADLVYLRGGDYTHQLKDILGNVKDLKSHFYGKIISGSSAGFIALAKYYFDQDDDTIQEGLNILPIKAISHFGLPNDYGRDFKKELEELKEYKKEEALETIALKETEFIIKCQ